MTKKAQMTFCCLPIFTQVSASRRKAARELLIGGAVNRLPPAS